MTDDDERAMFCIDIRRAQGVRTAKCFRRDSQDVFELTEGGRGAGLRGVQVIRAAVHGDG